MSFNLYNFTDSFGFKIIRLLIRPVIVTVHKYKFDTVFACRFCCQSVHPYVRSANSPAQLLPH
jgi:hypothetical protein